MNLFDFIRNTFVKNEPVWNYYGTNIYTDPIVAPEQSAQFIREYFIKAQARPLEYILALQEPFYCIIADGETFSVFLNESITDEMNNLGIV